MIATVEMRKLRVIGPKSVLRKTVEVLYRLKACHIQDHTKDATLDIGSPLENASALSEILVRVRSLISHLGLEGMEHSGEKDTLRQIDFRSKKLAEEVNALTLYKRELEAQLSSLQAKRNKILQLRTRAPVESFFSLKSVKGYVGTIPKDEEETFRAAIAGDTLTYESIPEENGHFIAFFVKREHAKKTDMALSQHGFLALDIKELEGYIGTPSAIEPKLSSEITKLGKKLAQTGKELSRHAKENTDFLLSAEPVLKEELLKAEAPLRFGNTKELFVVTGWVAASRVIDATKAITKAAQDKIHIDVEVPGHEEDVPVKLKNPAPMDSFESLIRLFSWPKYGEIDPTALMAFTLPLFFGMMLGDIGYGVIALFTFLFLRKRFPAGKPIFNVLILASVSTIIFGFLFGELFGLEVIAGYHLWHVLSRAHDVEALLFISFAIGLIHVNFGYALGFINEYKSHGLWMAITHKLSWVIIEFSFAIWLFLLFDVQFFGITDWLWPAVVVSAIGLYLLYKGEGGIGIVEIPSLISHTVSYVRIAAVGLASVFLAILINNFVGILFAKGIWWFVLLGIPLIVLGHGFNLALGVLSPFLHSLRLHYVEFFTKFYRGGGKEFTPFGEEPKQQPI